MNVEQRLYLARWFCFWFRAVAEYRQPRFSEYAKLIAIAIDPDVSQRAATAIHDCLTRENIGLADAVMALAMNLESAARAFEQLPPPPGSPPDRADNMRAAIGEFVCEFMRTIGN